MKIESATRQRCAECGEEDDQMVRMDRGGPFCFYCLAKAAGTLWDHIYDESDTKCPTCGAEYGHAYNDD